MSDILIDIITHLYDIGKIPDTMNWDDAEQYVYNLPEADQNWLVQEVIKA